MTDAEAFESWWTNYPRKISKGLARRAWAVARKKAEAQVIIEGLARYPFNPLKRLQPHPSTWLNQERWSDEPDIDPSDRWGLGSWYFMQSDPAWTQDGYAEILEMLNVPDRWTPDLDVIAGWARDGYKHSSVLDVLRELKVTEPMRHLVRFDAVVRRRAFRWDPGRLEYVRG